MNEDVAPVAVPPRQNGSPSNGRDSVRGGEGTTAPTKEQHVERSLKWTSSGDSAGSPRSSDRQERRTKLLVITGSAGGWVEVWEAGGLLAAAGLDE